MSPEPESSPEVTVMGREGGTPALGEPPGGQRGRPAGPRDTEHGQAPRGERAFPPGISPLPWSRVPGSSGCEKQPEGSEKCQRLRWEEDSFCSVKMGNLQFGLLRLAADKRLYVLASL